MGPDARHPEAPISLDLVPVPDIKVSGKEHSAATQSEAWGRTTDLDSCKTCKVMKNEQAKGGGTLREEGLKGRSKRAPG